MKNFSMLARITLFLVANSVLAQTPTSAVIVPYNELSGLRLLTSAAAEKECQPDYDIAKHYGAEVALKFNFIFPTSYVVQMNLFKKATLMDDSSDYDWNCSVLISLGNTLPGYQIQKGYWGVGQPVTNEQACTALIGSELSGKAIAYAKVYFDGTKPPIQNCQALVYEIVKQSQ